MHSPDGDSTTAPPSQSSEQSDVKNNKIEFHLNSLPSLSSSCIVVNNDQGPQIPDVKKIKKVY
jgi:hypothetical protein